MSIPKFHDERLGMLPEKYFTALGHLQYAYTSLEVQLSCTICDLVTLGYEAQTHHLLWERVKGILGGMRMDAAKDTLKRLVRIYGAPDEVHSYLGDLLKQLGEIQFFRNRLLHYHTSRRPQKPTVFVNTDLEVAKESPKAITFTFTYAALDAARHDLHLLSSILDEMFDWDQHSFVMKQPAWQYKPSMLTR